MAERTLGPPLFSGAEVAQKILRGGPEQDPFASDQLAPSVGEWRSPKPRVRCEDLRVRFAGREVLKGVTLDIGRNEVISVIGPSGAGKSTFLRCLNRMVEASEHCEVQGRVFLDGEDIYAPGVDAVSFRGRIGMVFPKPNPYPKSIYENVAYGLRIHGLVSCKSEESSLVELVFRQAGLWREFSRRLFAPALSLTAGEQQRLCIARALAVNPEVILMDEPCSSLDLGSGAKIEQMIDELRQAYTIVLVSHSLKSAARVSQRTAFIRQGRLVEVGPTDRMFTTPSHPLTDRFISGCSE